MQRDVLGIFAAQAIQPKDSVKELKDLALQMTVLREAMRGGTGTESQKADPAIAEQMAKLTETINKMKEEENSRKLTELEKSFMEKLDKMELNLKDRMSSITPGLPTVDEKLTITKFFDQMKEFETTKGSMRELLGVKEGGTGLDIKTALEEAKKLGYKIEGPKTIDEMEKHLTEQVEKMRKETIEETLKKVQSDDKKIAILVDIGTTAIEAILPAISQGQGGAAAGIAIAKKALKAAAAGT
jgi:hypothetical protein